MSREANKTLVCLNGHETGVYGWGKTPLACPHCVLGVPCGLPLNPPRKRGAYTTAQPLVVR